MTDAKDKRRVAKDAERVARLKAERVAEDAERVARLKAERVAAGRSPRSSRPPRSDGEDPGTARTATPSEPPSPADAY
jgi:hypothetical protein